MQRTFGKSEGLENVQGFCTLQGLVYPILFLRQYDQQKEIKILTDHQIHTTALLGPKNVTLQMP